jgi:hypothetical protein
MRREMNTNVPITAGYIIASAHTNALKIIHSLCKYNKTPQRPFKIIAISVSLAKSANSASFRLSTVPKISPLQIDIIRLSSFAGINKFCSAS